MIKKEHLKEIARVPGRPRTLPNHPVISNQADLADKAVQPKVTREAARDRGARGRDHQAKAAAGTSLAQGSEQLRLQVSGSRSGVG